jgi:hypothetical protein
LALTALRQEHRDHPVLLSAGRNELPGPDQRPFAVPRSTVLPPSCLTPACGCRTANQQNSRFTLIGVDASACRRDPQPGRHLETAEKILRRDGLAALSLRAIAREVGVSHGSPAHHFQNLGGLLSDLAAIGFRRLATVLGNRSAIRVMREKIPAALRRLRLGQSSVVFADVPGKPP